MRYNYCVSLTVVDCGPLSDPTNGMVDVPATTFESTANYTCTNTGYALVGDITRTCGSDGLWSGIEPTCDSAFSSLVHCVHCCLLIVFPAVVTCPALADPTNGTVGVPNNTYGSNATYTCNTGYNGDTTRTCGDDGLWSGSDPTCDREWTICSQLTAIMYWRISRVLCFCSDL